MESQNNSNQSISVFWFRRDLRLSDNTGLFHALRSGFRVLPVFIFDAHILSCLEAEDKRVSFIYQSLLQLNLLLEKYNTAIRILNGTPIQIFEKLTSDYSITGVYTNRDYEPYANERDSKVEKLLLSKGISFYSFKDQVIFEKNEICKSDGEPYTVYTPYSYKWKERLNTNPESLFHWKSEDYLDNFVIATSKSAFRLSDIGFKEFINTYYPFESNDPVLATYDKTRDLPSLDSTSRVGVHLRFGTVSIREIVSKALIINQIWLNELIWREFFMQILWHFPNVVNEPFKPKYKFINWINNENDFIAWCEGRTGIPLVDAGMRELNETGFMHNRVRMVTASFLVKHLLINWQWGEAYFARKLFDFDLSANNGNWQWAAGTGCDAAPYFRIFNPITQAEKFDPDQKYLRKWIPELRTSSYPKPIIDLNFARLRCLEVYKAAF